MSSSRSSGNAVASIRSSAAAGASSKAGPRGRCAIAAQAVDRPVARRAYLDRAAEASAWDPRRQRDRAVEVVGLEQQVAADLLLHLGERAVGDERVAVLRVLHARGRGAVPGGCCCRPGLTPGVWPIAL
jgi:hypothetical protein